MLVVCGTLCVAGCCVLLVAVRGWRFVVVCCVLCWLLLVARRLLVFVVHRCVLVAVGAGVCCLVLFVRCGCALVVAVRLSLWVVRCLSRVVCHGGRLQYVVVCCCMLLCVVVGWCLFVVCWRAMLAVVDGVRCRVCVVVY